MTKLLDAYRSNPTLKNACAIRRYERAHPMVVCTLSPVDFALLQQAIATADAKL